MSSRADDSGAFSERSIESEAAGMGMMVSRTGAPGGGLAVEYSVIRRRSNATMPAVGLSNVGAKARRPAKLRGPVESRQLSPRSPTASTHARHNHGAARARPRLTATIR